MQDVSPASNSPCQSPCAAAPASIKSLESLYCNPCLALVNAGGTCNELKKKESRGCQEACCWITEQKLHLLPMRVMRYEIGSSARQAMWLDCRVICCIAFCCLSKMQSVHSEVTVPAHLASGLAAVRWHGAMTTSQAAYVWASHLVPFSAPSWATLSPVVICSPVCCDMLLCSRTAKLQIAGCCWNCLQ